MEQQIQTQPVQFQLPENEKIDAVILDNSQIIEELVYTLQGKIVDNLTNEIRITGEPLVEEKAITWLIGRFVPYTSKIFSLSVLDERNIKQIIYEFEADLILELKNPEVLGVDRRHRDFVKNLMVHAFVATIYKAFKGETLKKLLIQYNISETMMRSEEERRGLFRRKKEPIKI
jgi:hypothetical protein